MLPSLAAVVDYVAALAATYGLPVLFVIFILKGALIGKVFSTAVFLAGYVIATGGSTETATTTVIVVTIGYMVGQLFIYGGTRQYGPPFLERIPRVNVDLESERAQRVTKWFHEYGGPAIFVTNFLPWFRGLLTIPAATSNYPIGRYTIYMGSSTLIYHAGYVVVALFGLSLFQ